MKIAINLFFLLIVTISSAQIIDFPEGSFKYALINLEVVDLDGDEIADSDVDTNNDNQIQVSEAEAVLGIDLTYAGIMQSLEGMEYFVNARFITCYENFVNYVDLTQNINLQKISLFSNQLTNLDLSQNVNLIRLNCSNNSLSNLNLSQNINLEWLIVDDNDISNLDISNNAALTFIMVGNNNLTGLNVSHLEYLSRLSCGGNQFVNLDLSQNVNLDALFCQNNSLINLNINNGANEILNNFDARGNPNLLCIQVDDENYANSRTCNDNNWCKDSTASYSEFCELVGIEEFASEDFKLFPIPTENILNIQSKLPIENVKIYSSQGILVNEDTSNTIDVSQLSAGIYFVEVTVDGKRATKKFIKV